MPRWLWPEPPRQGAALAPNSRPASCRPRPSSSSMAIWLPFLPPSNQTKRSPKQNLRRHAPLVCSQNKTADGYYKQANRDASQAHGNNSGAMAWPALQNTEGLLREKWLPAPLFPEETRGAYATPAVAHDLLTEDKLQAATRALKRGTAIDALGWSHEAWACAMRLPQARKLLTEVLLLHCTGALYEDAQGTAVRPIAIPTLFRKVTAKAAIATFKGPPSMRCTQPTRTSPIYSILGCTALPWRYYRPTQASARRF